MKIPHPMKSMQPIYHFVKRAADIILSGMALLILSPLLVPLMIILWITIDDPRVLPMGNLLGKTKINELPQLINIFMGNMSIVGPRPQTMECFNMFPADRRDRIYLSKPGLTGIGSIVFRNEEEIIGTSSKSYDNFIVRTSCHTRQTWNFGIWRINPYGLML